MSLRVSNSEGADRIFAYRPYLFVRQYRHWLSVLALMGADILALVLTAELFRRGRSVPELVFFYPTRAEHSPLDIFVVLSGIFLLVRYLAGDYSRRRLFWDSAKVTTISLMCCAAPALIIAVALPGQYSVFAELGSWLFLLVAIPTIRQGARIAMDRFGMWRAPTALISCSTRLRDVHATVSNTLSLGCDIRWLALDKDVEKSETLSKLKMYRLNDPHELAVRLAEDGCDQAVIATEDMQSRSFGDLIQRLMEVGISVSFIPTFHRLPLVGVTTSYFFGKDILLFQCRSSLQSLSSRFVKRLFDILGSLCALIILSPAFALLALAIKWHDPGPVFYAQKRTGRRGEPFKCLKFRTMAADADERLERWRVETPDLYAEFQKTFKLVNDPRITRLGGWLRKTSLDELPQLINVLRGEMSLVGPRPVLDRELIEYYGPAATLYKRVRPGLTGLWQVRGRSDTSYEERVVLDEWYILNWSFWYDIVILLQTVWVVLRREGAY